MHSIFEEKESDGEKEAILSEEEIDASFEMAEYEPEEGYDKYNVVEYTIEDIMYGNRLSKPVIHRIK